MFFCFYFKIQKKTNVIVFLIVFALYIFFVKTNLQICRFAQTPFFVWSKSAKKRGFFS